MSAISSLLVSLSLRLRAATARATEYNRRRRVSGAHGIGAICPLRAHREPESSTVALSELQHLNIAPYSFPSSYVLQFPSDQRRPRLSSYELRLYASIPVVLPYYRRLCTMCACFFREFHKNFIPYDGPHGQQLARLLSTYPINAASLTRVPFGRRRAFVDSYTLSLPYRCFLGYCGVTHSVCRQYLFFFRL